MRLNRQTDYALWLLMTVGLKPAEDLTTIQEVARMHGISEGHLMKIVRKLGQAGFLKTVRGRHGGFRLGRPAAEIRLGAVVRAMEEDLALVQCLEGAAGAAACRLTGPCRLVCVLDDALAAFMTVLDRYSLTDLLAPADGLARQLSLPRNDLSAAAGT